MSAVTYLTYEPWPAQLNNTRRCVETMVALAALLRRTLVMPDRYSRELTDIFETRVAWPHPSTVFDLETLRRSIDVIVEDASGGEWRDARRLEIDVEPGTAVLCHPACPTEGTPSYRRLLEFAANRRIFLALPADHAAYPVIHLQRPFELFYTFLFLPDADDRRLKRLMRDTLVFRPEIEALAARAIAALGVYDAVHIRRGDFIYQYGDRVDLPSPAIARSLHTLIPARGTLYVATDEADARYHDALRERFTLVFLRDVLDVDALPAEVAACVEQVICAHARRFVGTSLSTFSAYVTRMRGYRGMSDLGIYVTDGRQDEADATARYSWAASVRAGLPIWARDYREGWEID